MERIVKASASPGAQNGRHRARLGYPGSAESVRPRSPGGRGAVGRVGGAQQAQERLHARDDFLVAGQAVHCGLELPAQCDDPAVRLLGPLVRAHGRRVQGAAQFGEGPVLFLRLLLQDTRPGLGAVQPGVQFDDVVPRIRDVLEEGAQAPPEPAEVGAGRTEESAQQEERGEPVTRELARRPGDRDNNRRRQDVTRDRRPEHRAGDARGLGVPGRGDLHALLTTYRDLSEHRMRAEVQVPGQCEQEQQPQKTQCARPDGEHHRGRCPRHVCEGQCRGRRHDGHHRSQGSAHGLASRSYIGTAHRPWLGARRHE